MGGIEFCLLHCGIFKLARQSILLNNYLCVICVCLEWKCPSFILKQVYYQGHTVGQEMENVVQPAFEITELILVILH